MPGLDFNQIVVPGRTLPAPVPDGGPQFNVRAGRYREQYALSLVPTKHLLADEGSYFIGTNPTPGTAIANDIKTGWVDTVPWIYMFNKESSASPSAKRIYLDYIKTIVTTAAASGTTAYYAVIGDTVQRFPTTNNMTAITPANANMDLSGQSIAQLYSQSNLTASAVPASSSNKRILARGSFGGLTIVGDELVMVFGSSDIGSYPGLTAVQATCPGRKCSSSPPIVLGPQQSLVVHMWFANNAATALSYELEMGWWER